MEEKATIEQFKQAIIAQEMPDDKLAQQALEIAIEQLLFSIWLARQHKKNNDGEKRIFTLDDA